MTHMSVCRARKIINGYIWYFYDKHLSPYVSLDRSMLQRSEEHAAVHPEFGRRFVRLRGSE